MLFRSFTRDGDLKPHTGRKNLTCRVKRCIRLVWTQNRSLPHWEQVYCQQPHIHDKWDSKNVLMEVWWQFCVHKTSIPKVHLCICYIFWCCFFFSFKLFKKVRIYAQKAIKREKLAEAIRRQHEWLERFIITKSRRCYKYPRRLHSRWRQLCRSLFHYVKDELCFPPYCASPPTQCPVCSSCRVETGDFLKCSSLLSNTQFSFSFSLFPSTLAKK